MLPSVRHMSKVTLIMGVCGCGKTTVGEALASATGGTYIEGDAYHPSVNVEKMRSGQPLTDQDRQGWLEQLADAIREQATDEVAKPGLVNIGIPRVFLGGMLLVMELHESGGLIFHVRDLLIGHYLFENEIPFLDILFLVFI